MAALEHRYGNLGGPKLHYVIAGSGEPVLLIHGFPQTWYEWKGIIPELAKHYTVIAPDYRGAGDSERTQGGYDKHTMMEDLRSLVHELGFKKLRVVGHDIGVMIAYRYAAVHPDEVLQLVLMDAPIPGTDAAAAVRSMPRSWHINFHSVRELPEALVAGKEREYLTAFYKSRFTVPDAIPPEDIDVYLASYASPGGMRAGFELYRAWAQDGIDNAPYLENKLEMPVLVLGGDASASGPLLQGMTNQIASNGQFELIAKSGHWLAEQNPKGVQERLLRFFETPDA